MKVLEKALELADAGTDCALVTVIAVRGSTPRHVGARMLVLPSGEIVGSVGGGAIEKEAVDRAQGVLREGRADRFKQDLVQDLAMCCGGSMELYLEPFGRSVPAIREALAARRARVSLELVTPLDGGPKLTREWDKRRKSTRIVGEELVEVITPRDRLVLFGCGHVTRAIGPIARSVGFELVVCDDNETGAIDDKPEWVDVLVPSFAISDLETELGGLGSGDYLVIVTRDHAVDQRILESALPLVERLSYLGMIGSRGKVGRFRKRILAKGLVDEEGWARLHAPIGVDIRAETPEEIAVSLMAELISLRNRELKG